MAIKNSVIFKIKKRAIVITKTFRLERQGFLSKCFASVIILEDDTRRFYLYNVGTYIYGRFVSAEHGLCDICH